MMRALVSVLVSFGAYGGSVDASGMRGRVMNFARTCSRKG
jgi:hypothetical protein